MDGSSENKCKVISSMFKNNFLKNDNNNYNNYNLYNFV